MSERIVPQIDRSVILSAHEFMVIVQGLLSDVISEQGLHLFARKHLPTACDFLDVPPVYLRRAYKT